MIEQFLNKIIQGDCLEVMKGIPDKSVDMILCDLPYGTTACKWDSIIPFEPLWKQYERVIKDNGAIVLTASQPFTSALVMSNPKMFKYEWIWEKDKSTNFLNAKKQPLRNHESVIVFYKKQPVYNMQYWTSKPMNTVYNCGGVKNDSAYGTAKGYKNVNINRISRKPVTIIKFNTVNGQSREKVKHPTQKPVNLFEYLIKTYTNHGEIVLDNCIGSGTTAIAALNTGRFFIGIEKEPEYIEIAKRRVDDWYSSNAFNEIANTSKMMIAAAQDV